MRGVRIQNIVTELSGEKIDVIPWDADPATFVASALSPAQVQRVDISDEEKTATVIVPERQLSLAIGREGQNARLAARLTGWRIDIKSDAAVARAELERWAQEGETSDEGATSATDAGGDGALSQPATESGDVAAELQSLGEDSAPAAVDSVDGESVAAEVDGISVIGAAADSEGPDAASSANDENESPSSKGEEGDTNAARSAEKASA
jgi:N utilization substance protein A